MITYKVWVQVERHDPDTDDDYQNSEPEPLEEFETFEEAARFVRRLPGDLNPADFYARNPDPWGDAETAEAQRTDPLSERRPCPYNELGIECPETFAEGDELELDAHLGKHEDGGDPPMESYSADDGFREEGGEE